MCVYICYTFTPYWLSPIHDCFDRQPRRSKRTYWHVGVWVTICKYTEIHTFTYIHTYTYPHIHAFIYILTTTLSPSPPRNTTKCPPNRNASSASMNSQAIQSICKLQIHDFKTLPFTSNKVESKEFAIACNFYTHAHTHTRTHSQSCIYVCISARLNPSD